MRVCVQRLFVVIAFVVCNPSLTATRHSEKHLPKASFESLMFEDIMNVRERFRGDSSVNFPFVLLRRYLCCIAGSCWMVHRHLNIFGTSINLPLPINNQYVATSHVVH